VSTILRIEGLSKNYGSINAVQNLSLEIKKGQVYGILGPNGSGKTTTLGMILGIINPNAGNYVWFNEEPIINALYNIGSIIETPSFYPYLSAIQNLKIVADIKKKEYNQISDILDRVGLGERKNSAFKTYSLGMKQRLALAASMVGNPRVLVLDEPTNGMDPQGIADIRNLILDIANKGTTIILASHLLDEVQKICSHVAVLEKGKKIFDDSVERILAADDYLEVWAEESDQLFELLKSFKGIENISKEHQKFIVKLSAGPSKKDLQKYLIQNGIFPSHFITQTGSLEQKFLELLTRKK